MMFLKSKQRINNWPKNFDECKKNDKKKTKKIKMKRETITLATTVHGYAFLQAMSALNLNFCYGPANYF